MKVAVVHAGGAACRNAFLRVVLGKDEKVGRIKGVIALSLRLMKSGIFFLESESEVLLDASWGLFPVTRSTRIWLSMVLFGEVSANLKSMGGTGVRKSASWGNEFFEELAPLDYSGGGRMKDILRRKAT